jgi:FMN phosphatase YigB (HAD superfamily)
MYDTIVERLGVAPERCLMVGDNWLADIQGAKRAGMFAAHITQYETVEHFEPGPDDHPADLTITTLAELNDWLPVRSV